MIVSHKHQFIFIKTQKTAGTSTEIALSGICGPDDIITPISHEDETYRRSLGFRSRQNYHIPLKFYRRKDFAEAVVDGRRLRYFNHMSGMEVRRYLDRGIWKGYYKFAFERNPFDKLISWYYWLGGDKKFGSIAHFIHSGRAGKIKGFDLYTEGGNIILDRIYKFEELKAALSHISETLGVKVEVPERKAKGSVRDRNKSYQEMLNPYEKSWVQKVFARELAFFDYAF